MLLLKLSEVEALLEVLSDTEVLRLRDALSLRLVDVDSLSLKEVLSERLALSLAEVD